MNAERPNSEPRAVLEQMLPLLLNHDLEGLSDLYAEDAVHELPYLPDPANRRLEGRDQIRAYYRDLGDIPLEFEEFTEVAIHDTTEADVIVAEIDARGVHTTTGQGFTMRYVWVLRTESGRIKHWRDYWNPGDLPVSA